MRILHIVTAFPRNELDIITPWLVEMLKRFRAEGLEVEIFTPAYKGLGDQVLWGIPVRRFRYFFRRWENLTHEETTPDRMKKSLLYKILPAFYLFFGMIAIWRLCRRERYDAVHVHWPMPHALFGWAARAARRTRIVTTFYGVELRWVKRSLPFLKGFLVWAAKTSDRVVAISTYTAGEIKELADVPVDVIPYTIGFSDEPAPAAAVKETSDRNILFVGRLVERKGVVYLIEAMKYLPESLKVRLVIVGEGPQKKYLEQAATDICPGGNVRFTGMITDAAKLDEYRRAAAFVLPAIVDSKGDTEGLGVVLLEAMHHRVPVIGSDLGGITDIIIDGRTGLLVPQKDAKALAEAIERVLADPALSARLAEGGYRHLQENFSWSGIIEKWKKLYRGLA